MSSSYVATVPSSEPRQPSPQYSATRTHWAPEDMAQSSHAYRYATTDAHHSYNYTTPPRGLYDVQQASYSRRPQNESLPPPMPMEPQHQEYSISSYPDPNQQFSTGRIDDAFHQPYDNSQIPRSARGITRRDLVDPMPSNVRRSTYPLSQGSIGSDFEAYGVPQSIPAPSMTFPPSDARRRLSTDSGYNGGNPPTAWDHLPSIASTMPAMEDWNPNSFEPLDSRRSYEAWHSRGPTVIDSSMSARFPVQTPSTNDYSSMYPSTFSESGGSGSSSSFTTTPTPAPSSTSASRTSSPPPPRPYSCEICGFSFARNHDLTRHIRGHEPAQFGCERCGKAYTRLDSLRRHYVRKRCGPNYMAS